MTGIIAAMKMEAEHIEAAMTGISREEISGVEYISGSIGTEEVVLAVCGIGKVYAAICAQTMILRYHPGFIINTGVGGSLSPELKVFNLAVAKSVVQHDMDTSALGDPVGFISGMDRIEIPCDAGAAARILAVAQKMGVKCLTGVIASGDVFVSQKEKKEQLVKRFGAIACEMEGAAVGHVCYVNRIPFVVLRAISDSADGSAEVDYPTFSKKAARKSAELLIAFLQSAK